MQAIFAFSLAISLFGNSFAHTNYLSDLKNSLLFQYDRTTKPFEHVTVEVAVRPINLKLCPHSQVLTLYTWNTYKWTDPRLVWNPDHHENITELKFFHDQIYIPDVTIYDIVEEVKQVINYQLIVYSNGKVLMVPYEINKIFCKVNYDNLPFGPQKCEFKIGSWHHSIKDLDVKVESTHDTEKFWNNHYEILNTNIERNEKTYSCCPEAYPRLEVALEFQQKMKYHDGTLKKSE